MVAAGYLVACGPEALTCQRVALRRWSRTKEIQAALSFDHTLHVTGKEDSKGTVLITVDVDTKHSKRSKAQALATLLEPYGTVNYEGGGAVRILATYGNEALAPQPLPTDAKAECSLAKLALGGNTMFSQVRARVELSGVR